MIRDDNDNKQDSVSIQNKESNIPKNEITQLKNYYEDIKSLVRVKDVVFSESPDDRFNHKSIDVDGKEIKIFINWFC